MELLAYFRGRLPDPQEAEDYVQQTFERSLRLNVENQSAVMYVIATNLLKNEYRDRARRRGTEEVSWEKLIGPLGEGLDHLPQFQTLDYEDYDFAESFDRSVRDLEETSRDAFILGELRGLPSREAAPLLGVSHMTANYRRELATTSIREELSV